jgi:hypothetical protein
MSKRKRGQAEGEARRIAHAHTQREEGYWLGDVRDHPVAQEVIRRYNEASSNLRACPHLQADFDQARFWVEAVPELLACKLCTPALAAEEQKRRDSRCVMCGEHVPLRGFSIAAAGALLRAGVCQKCETQHGLLDQAKP